MLESHLSEDELFGVSEMKWKEVDSRREKNKATKPKDRGWGLCAMGPEKCSVESGVAG